MQVETGFNKSAGSVVGVLGLIMIVLPVAQTVARKFFGAEIPSASVVVQNLTLWVGFLGALLAAGTGRHLALSTAEAIPEGWPRRVAKVISRAVAAAVCALLAYASVKVVQADWGSERTVFWVVRVGWSETIMPIAFGFMSLRFIWREGKGEQRWSDRGIALLATVLALCLSFVSPSPVMVGLLAIITLVAFLVGAPVFVAMGGAGMLLFWNGGTPIAAVPAETFRLVSSATLPAIPLLTIAGYVLAEGGAARRLVRAYKGFFGWLPGGVAVMVTVVCALFTTFTGGSGVTILALGGLLLPMLQNEKYPDPFSYGLVTASGSLGLLFPPSLPVLLYAVVAGVPVGQLYLGGLVPGLLMISMVAVYGVITGVRYKVPRQKFVLKEAASGLWGAKWDLGLPLLMVVTVGSGFATVVEASALACTYALIVEIVVFRDLHPWRDLPRVLVTAAMLVGAVVILLGVAMGLSAWLVDAEIPSQLLDWTTSHVKSPLLFLLLLTVFLLVVGSAVEIYAAIVVLAPLVVPIGAAYGIHPVHLGVVFLATLELGFLFPPMGVNLFLSATRFKKPLPQMYRNTFPYLLILAVGVLLITYLDVMTTGVLKLAGSAATGG